MGDIGKRQNVRKGVTRMRIPNTNSEKFPLANVARNSSTFYDFFRILTISDLQDYQFHFNVFDDYYFIITFYFFTENPNHSKMIQPS